MTIIERTSNTEMARGMKRSIRSMLVKLDERGPYNPQSEAERAPARTSADDTQAKADWLADPASVRRLSSAVAVARDQAAAVIGMTGSRRGIGVSVSSRQLAHAFASFGIKTLFVDLSRMSIATQARPERSADDSIFLTSAQEITPTLSVVSFDTDHPPSLTESELRAALAHAAQSSFTVVVDLPPVLESSGAPSPSIAPTGLACDLVFLVCLSGGMSSAEVQTCVEACRIIGLKVGGLVLNDWQMPAVGFIES